MKQGSTRAQYINRLIPTVVVNYWPKYKISPGQCSVYVFINHLFLTTVVPKLILVSEGHDNIKSFLVLVSTEKFLAENQVVVEQPEMLFRNF